MLDLIAAILHRLDHGEAIALCTLAQARGSTPQATGAMMVVFANGQTLGTLGGGCIEAEVRTRAIKSLANGERGDTHLRFKLDQDYGWDDGLMCGGVMDVTMQNLHTPGDAIALVAVRDALSINRSATYSITAKGEGGESRIFNLSIAPKPTLLIAGAGHVGQALALLAHEIDFDAVVFDDRAEVMTEARFPSAKRIVGTIDQELARWPIEPHTYVVIVTRGHRNDAAALRVVIDSPAAYIGMIGSKRKVRTILGGLETHGVAREKLLRVHAPIGLELGAITPGEIAVSVAAELIAIRRGRGSEAATPLKIERGELERWLDRESPS